MEVLFQLTPVMGVTLLVLSLGYERLWAVLPPSPYFASLGMTLLSLALIFVGALVAFAMVGAAQLGLCCASCRLSGCCTWQPRMELPCKPPLCMWGAAPARPMPAVPALLPRHAPQVVAEFALIANTSALTFMVAGTFKEIVTGGCRTPGGHMGAGREGVRCSRSHAGWLRGARMALPGRLGRACGCWRFSQCRARPLPCPPAVAAAVLFLGESFTWINGLGLLVLILGV